MENEPGALSRVVGLFSQRGYNIESLNVAPTTDHTLSRLTLTTTGDDLKIEQITKHLNKIVANPPQILNHAFGNIRVLWGRLGAGWPS